jgi:predicted peroxiredoxin
MLLQRRIERGGRSVKFLYMSTTGTADPTRASIPLHMAVNGSAEVGHDVTIVLAGDAAELMLGDNAEKLQGLGVPPMRELLQKIKDHEIPVYV